jgi:hypothetical protein
VFPADAPQLVVLAKLDRPRSGQIYGGVVAAPILKAVIEGAFASSRTSIDRRELAAQAVAPIVLADSLLDSALVATEPSAPRPLRRPRSDAGDGAVPYLMAITPGARNAPAPPVVPRAVPRVSGLSLRDALLTLHEQGFRVVVDTVAGGGTSPAAGTPALPGTIIRLHRAQ